MQTKFSLHFIWWRCFFKFSMKVFGGLRNCLRKWINKSEVLAFGHILETMRLFFLVPLYGICLAEFTMNKWAILSSWVWFILGTNYISLSSVNRLTVDLSQERMAIPFFKTRKDCCIRKLSKILREKSLSQIFWK